MSKLLTALAALLSLGLSAKAESIKSFSLDYEQMVILDAENLAETGIKEAYEKLIPALKKYIENPAGVVEKTNSNPPSYSVYSAGVNYEIYSSTSSASEAESWGKATYALFSIVNGQLGKSEIKFYAVNGGNDLGGIFLTQEQAVSARKNLKNKTDWPYLPTKETEWYGQYH